MPTTINPSDQTITQYTVQVGGASNLLASVGPGSSGQVLQSAGNASNPAYSTATYPSTAGTSGNILTSDGTNFVSSAIVGNIKIATLTLNATQIRALNSSPAEIVAAPAAGSVLIPLSLTCKFNYGGNNAFVTGGNLNLYSSGTAGKVWIQFNTAIYTGTVDNIYAAGAVAGGSAAFTNIEAQNLVLATATIDPTGNASNDNTLVFSLLYQVLTM